MQTQDFHSSKPLLKDGDSFYCEHCHSRSILRVRNEYDGFTVKRTYYCCAFCNEEYKPPVSGSADAPPAPSSSHSLDAWDSLFSGSSDESSSSGSGDALDNLFGSPAEDSPESLESILPSPAVPEGKSSETGAVQYHFCKDCLHHFENPFRVHCVLHDKDVEPLSDCPDFSPLPRRN